MPAHVTTNVPPEVNTWTRYPFTSVVELPPVATAMHTVRQPSDLYTSTWLVTLWYRIMPASSVEGRWTLVPEGSAMASLMASCSEQAGDAVPMPTLLPWNVLPVTLTVPLTSSVYPDASLPIPSVPIRVAPLTAAVPLTSRVREELVLPTYIFVVSP